LNGVKLEDGRIRLPDGRIVTPTVTVLDLQATQPDATAGNSSPPQTGSSSIYPDQYRTVPGAPGVMPVGGFDGLTLARDVPTLSSEFTPTLADGRPGVGIPYRDQAGNLFYRTFDANGSSVGWVSAPVTAAALPFAARLAPVAEGVLAAEATFGPPPLRVLATGTLLAGTGLAAWWAARNTDGLLQREALTPEEIRDLQAPPIYVPAPPLPPLPGFAPAPADEQHPPVLPGPPLDQPQGPSIEVLPAGPQQTPDDLIVTRNPDGNPPKPDYVPSRTSPTGDLGGTPDGTPSASRGGERGIDRENEAAAAAANAGYRVVQNPTLTPEQRQAAGISATADPDLLIEGKVFDVKSPFDAAAAETAISDSVGKEQARRFLINAEDFADPEAGARDLAARLRERPPQGLQEVKILVNGVIRNIFP
jgi:hypothetical protein